MIIKISNEVFQEQKRYSAQHKLVDLWTDDLSDMGKPRPELWIRVHKMTTFETYNRLKRWGYKFDSDLMQWKLKG